MATVKFNLEADEAKAVQAFLRVVDAQNKAEKQFKKTTNAGKKQDQGLNKMIATAGKMAAGYLTVRTAINAVSGALDRMNAANDRAADSLKTTKFDTGKLFQIYDTPELQGRARAAMHATRLQTGMAREQAANLQFQLGSNQFDFQGANAREFFAGFYGTSRDPVKLIRGSKKLLTGFGKKEVGDYRRAVNKLLVASETSDIGVDEMGTAAAKISLSAGSIGATDEESLAILSQLALAFDSSDTAATSIRALATGIDKAGLGGKGFAAAIQKIESNPELRKKISANVRAKDALNAYIKERGAIGDLEKQLIAEDQLPVGKGAGARVKLGMFGGLSELSREAIAVRRNAISEQRLLIDQEDRRGIGELNLQSRVNEIASASERNRDNFIVQGARVATAEFVKSKFEAADEKDIQLASEIAGTIAENSPLVLLINAIQGLAEDIKENSSVTKENTQGGNKSARNGGMVE